jgi:hypothetical protein
MFCANCGDDISSGRCNLGYQTCLSCGDKQARKIKRCVVPLNKSNYVLITNLIELTQLNPKRT